MTTTRTALDIVATTPDAQTDAERHAALLGDLPTAAAAIRCAGVR